MQSIRESYARDELKLRVSPLLLVHIEILPEEVRGLVDIGLLRFRFASWGDARITVPIHELLTIVESAVLRSLAIGMRCGCHSDILTYRLSSLLYSDWLRWENDDDDASEARKPEARAPTRKEPPPRVLSQRRRE